MKLREVPLHVVALDRLILRRRRSTTTPPERIDAMPDTDPEATEPEAEEVETAAPLPHLDSEIAFNAAKADD